MNQKASIDNYRSQFIDYLKNQSLNKKPVNLYEPISYVLNQGGKRSRPVLTLLGCEILHGKAENALPVAMAIETFHNFTLLHDDIMDNAPTRRNQPTVHKKWNENTAILSGDAMLIKAYQYLNKYGGDRLAELFDCFNQTALEVCEGQQMDMDFENEPTVSLDDYLEMIRLKTAVLLGASLKCGGMVANGDSNELDSLYEIGVNLGLAFQIQDDYLDAFGDPKKVGKQLGGDIIENKKTFLFLSALQNAGIVEHDELLQLYGSNTLDPRIKIDRVKSIMESSGAKKEAQNCINAYSEKALEGLKQLNGNQEASGILGRLIEQLRHRQH